MIIFLFLFFIVLLAHSPVAGQSAKHENIAKRYLTPENLFHLEQIGDVTFSPDGQWIAFEYIRAGFANEHALFKNIHSDIWIVSVQGGEPIQVTDGQQTDTGYCNPVWSPDGKRLGIVSITGEQILGWAWERSSKKMMKLTEAHLHWPHARPLLFSWISNHEMVCFVWPSEVKGYGVITWRNRSGARLAREWRKAWMGDSVTVDVIDSVLPNIEPEREQSRVIVVDVRTGKYRTIMTGPYRHFHLSPGHNDIAAFYTPNFSIFDAEDRLATEYFSTLLQGTHLRIFDIQGHEVVNETPSIGPLEHTSAQWSPDNRQFAFVAQSSDTRSVTLIDIEKTSTQKVSPPDYKVKKVAWTKRGDLLAFMQSNDNLKESRPDWWQMNSGGNWDLITGKMRVPPPILLPLNDLSSLIGISDGDLWLIDLDKQEAENLTTEMQMNIHSFVWPTRQINHAKVQDKSVPGVNKFVVRSKTDDGTDGYFTVSISNNNVDITPIKLPSSDATFEDFSPVTGSVLFAAKNADGTFLWTTDTANQSRDRTAPFLAMNTWLQDIDQGEFKKIEYQSLRGETLIAWLVLPPDYKAGNRYPLVADVYAGRRYNSKNPPRNAHVNYASTSNRQLLAAKGYVILFPSMPMAKPMGGYAEMLDGVLPAVDKAIDLGIADKDRLGLIGHSMGGFSVYSIIGQTDRFKAAVSMSGQTNYMSFYGIPGPEAEYMHPLLKMTHRMSQIEDTFGSPPWKDIHQYWGKSPIAYVDRVETPLMIIQGDLDASNIQQAEEFFTALYRQGKRVRFLRYHGEGHLITGLANTLNMWDHIYDWFDKYLKEKKPTTR